MRRLPPPLAETVGVEPGVPLRQIRAVCGEVACGGAAAIIGPGVPADVAGAGGGSVAGDGSYWVLRAAERNPRRMRA